MERDLHRHDAAPYSCGGVDTTQVVDGAYELRMQATDTLGHTSFSASVPVTIDNTAPTATNVQAANGGAAGTINAGDTVTFTWSEPMAPVSILAGWSGASQPIRVRVTDAAAADTLDLYNAAGTVRLNVMSATQALRLQADWVSATVNFDATLVMTGSSATVTLGVADRERRAPHRRRHDGEHDLEPLDRRDRRRRQPRRRDGRHRDRRPRPRLLGACQRSRHAVL